MQYVADPHQYMRYDYNVRFYGESISIFFRGSSVVCICQVDLSLSRSSEGILYTLSKSIFKRNSYMEHIKIWKEYEFCWHYFNWERVKCNVTSSWFYISVINQIDAKNFCFTISLFHASTCFEHMFSSSGGQNLHYSASGIITPIGMMIPEAV